MSLGDYLRGPEYKANTARLEVELQVQQHKSQVELQAQQHKSRAELQALQAKYNDLEAKAREIGLMDLLAIKKQTLVEEELFSSVKTQIAAAQGNLAAAHSQLQAVQQQILGAEDTIQLESFSLYEPKYQFTNSIDYKIAGNC